MLAKTDSFPDISLKPAIVSHPYYFKFIFIALIFITGRKKAEVEEVLAENNEIATRFMYSSLKRTLLHKAAEIGDCSICDLLIEHGADVNKEDVRKQTPLWLAAKKGHGNVCNMLIGKGAFVSIKDATGKTPLWIAASKAHEEVCEILIDNGACTWDRDEYGVAIIRLVDSDMFCKFTAWENKYSKI